MVVTTLLRQNPLDYHGGYHTPPSESFSLPWWLPHSSVRILQFTMVVITLYLLNPSVYHFFHSLFLLFTLVFICILMLLCLPWLMGLLMMVFAKLHLHGLQALVVIEPIKHTL